MPLLAPTNPLTSTCPSYGPRVAWAHTGRNEHSRSVVHVRDFMSRKPGLARFVRSVISILILPSSTIDHVLLHFSAGSTQRNPRFDHLALAGALSLCETRRCKRALFQDPP